MSRVLVIGCGGVASVAISKCCQVSEVFTELCIASRTKEKCDALAEKLREKTSTKITTAQVDADQVQQVIDLINDYKPDLVMNIALPYQDLTIMDACLACGVNYMDTANYEPEDTDDPEWRAIYEKRCEEKGFSAYFDYSWQWAYREKFERMPQSMSSTRLRPSISWTATAATTAIPLPPTSIRRSISGRFPPPAATGRTDTGWRSRP